MRRTALPGLLALLVASAAASAAPAPMPTDDETVRTMPDGSTVITISPANRSEPRQQKTVVEDGRARIEELRVRGQLTRVTVTPKGRAPAYDIVVGDGGRDVIEGPSPARGTVGKRVWNVLAF